MSPRQHRGRTLVGTLGSFTLLATILPTCVDSSASTALSSVVLYAGHGIVVVAQEDGSTTCDNRVLFSSDDGPWRNVTPPIGRANSCAYVWTGASFVSSTTGWLLGRDTGDDTTVLERTDDAGVSWSAGATGTTGSNGGYEQIGLVTADFGWRQQVGIGSNLDFALQTSSNGGSSFSTATSDVDRAGGCGWADDSFAGPSNALASEPLAGDSDNSYGTMWRTTDGGRHWSRLSLLASNSLTPVIFVYGEPTFFGRRGMVPVDEIAGRHQTLAMFRSTDGGAAWSEIATPYSPTPLAGRVGVSSAEDACIDGLQLSGAAVAVDVISPTTWWTVQDGTAGSARVTLITSAGRALSHPAASGLPATTGALHLAATSSHDWLITIGIDGPTYVSDDSGGSWRLESFALGKTP